MATPIGDGASGTFALISPRRRVYIGILILGPDPSCVVLCTQPPPGPHACSCPMHQAVATCKGKRVTVVAALEREVDTSTGQWGMEERAERERERPALGSQAQGTPMTHATGTPAETQVSMT